MLAGALNLVACSKATETAGAAADLATQAGLTSTLTSKLGISEQQASAALGSLLGTAKTELPPSDYAKLAGALPGAESYLAAAEGAGVLPGAGAAAGEVAGEAAGAVADTTAPIPGVGADTVAGAVRDTAAGVAAGVEDMAAGAMSPTNMLTSSLSKLGIPPEAASQFIPVVTDYVGKVGGPEVANIVKGLFPI
jgi:hypothetical protein